RVLNVSTIEPLDRLEIIAAARETRAILTLEEATTTGGLGAAIGEVVLAEFPVPVRMLGVPRQFAPTGTTAFLLEHFGLSADGITDAAQELLVRAW
ncbi:MAG: transketolase C-terminal domain-containing protein, partial [Nostocoides sp.]